MSEMNVRSDAVDVEQIMRQIRARIKEKRGADYTETELQQLATVKLERFLDPTGLRSNLVAEYRRTRVVPPAPPNYAFGEETLYETHRGLLKTLRGLFKPILKLFFNPDKIVSALHIQAEVNTQAEARIRALESREPLSYELLHNLTLEITRLGIEVHNLKMRVESLSSRLDFDERRAKSLESVVQYRQPPAPRPQALNEAPAQPSSSVQFEAQPAVAPGGSPSQAAPGGGQGGPGQNGGNQAGNGRRRRRRRRRRPGGTMAEGQGQTWSREAAGADANAQGSAAGDAGPDDDGADDGPDSDSTDQ
jgi:hypothetical protein